MIHLCQRGREHVSRVIVVGADNTTVPTLMGWETADERVKQGELREVIMAISPTIEGETTIFYISKKLQPLGVQMSSIARGVAFGGDLDYADEVTLGRSIVARVPYATK